LNYLDKFWDTQIQNFIKVGPMGAELYQADRQADRHDAANFAFRNFANVPNMEPQYKK